MVSSSKVSRPQLDARKMEGHWILHVTEEQKGACLFRSFFSENRTRKESGYEV